MHRLRLNALPISIPSSFYHRQPANILLSRSALYPSHPSRSLVIPGYALPVHTYEFFTPRSFVQPSARAPDQQPSSSSSSSSSPPSTATTIIPRSQWTVGRIGYGLDDYGLPLRTRMKYLREIIVQKRNNFILLDGEELLKRCVNTATKTSLPTNTVTINNVTLMIPSLPPMERVILHELLLTKEPHIPRSQLVLGVQLTTNSSTLLNLIHNGTTTANTGYPKLTIENQLDIAVQYLLRILGLSTLDIVVLHFPPTASTTSPSPSPSSPSSPFQLTPERGPKLVNYLAWLEACVGKGYIQYYGLNIDLLSGISMDKIHPSNDLRVVPSSSSSSTSTDDLYKRLEQLLFASLGRIKGQAKRIRNETVSLGNMIDYFSNKEETGSTDPHPSPTTSAPVPSIPVQDDHHLIMLLSPANILRWGPLVPRSSTRSTTTAKGYETWSQLLFSSYQISTFLHHPLDVVHQGKAFRCVGLSFDRTTVRKDNLYRRSTKTSSTTDITTVHTNHGYHPADIAPYLQDSFNLAIALETTWDKELKTKLIQQYPTITSSVQALPSRTVAWARILGSNLQTMDSAMTWSFIKHVHIFTAIENLVELLPSENEQIPVHVRKWVKDYQNHMYNIIGYIDILMGQIQAERVSKVMEILQNRLTLMMKSTENGRSIVSATNNYAHQNLTTLVLNMLLNNEGQVQGVFTEIPEAYGIEPDTDITQYPYRIVVPERKNKTGTDSPMVTQSFDTKNALVTTFTPLDIGKLIPSEVYDNLLDAMVGKPPISIE